MLIYSNKAVIFGLAAAIGATSCLYIRYSNITSHCPYVFYRARTKPWAGGAHYSCILSVFRSGTNLSVLLHGIASDLLSLPRVGAVSLLCTSLVKCESSVCAKNIYFRTGKITPRWTCGLTGFTVNRLGPGLHWSTRLRNFYFMPGPRKVWLFSFLQGTVNLKNKNHRYLWGRTGKIHIYRHKYICRVHPQGQTSSTSIRWLGVCVLA